MKKFRIGAKVKATVNNITFFGIVESVTVEPATEYFPELITYKIFPDCGNIIFGVKQVFVCHSYEVSEVGEIQNNHFSDEPYHVYEPDDIDEKTIIKIEQSEAKQAEKIRSSGRPKLPYHEKKQQLLCKLPPNVIKKLKQTAKNESISQSILIERAVKYYCSQTDLFK